MEPGSLSWGDNKPQSSLASRCPRGAGSLRGRQAGAGTAPEGTGRYAQGGDRQLTARGSPGRSSHPPAAPGWPGLLPSRIPETGQPATPGASKATGYAESRVWPWAIADGPRGSLSFLLGPRQTGQTQLCPQKLVGSCEPRDHRWQAVACMTCRGTQTCIQQQVGPESPTLCSGCVPRGSSGDAATVPGGGRSHVASLTTTDTGEGVLGGTWAGPSPTTAGDRA